MPTAIWMFAVASLAPVPLLTLALAWGGLWTWLALGYITLAVALLDELGKGDAKVATSVNEAFVPEHQRVDHSLQDGDRVEIVAPRQGG